jgi:hypothetical protein
MPIALMQWASALWARSRRLWPLNDLHDSFGGLGIASVAAAHLQERILMRRLGLGVVIALAALAPREAFAQG